MIDMGRDLASSLADIDISGFTEMFVGKAPQMSPEQIAQLEVIPPARTLWKAGVEEGQAAVFLPVFENGTLYVASTNGLLVRFNATTGKASGVIDTKHKLSGGVGTGEGMLLVGTFKGEVLAFDEKSGNRLWKAQVSTEVLSPPHARKRYGSDSYGRRQNLQPGGEQRQAQVDLPGRHPIVDRAKFRGRSDLA